MKLSDQDPSVSKKVITLSTKMLKKDSYNQQIKPNHLKKSKYDESLIRSLTLIDGLTYFLAHYRRDQDLPAKSM